MLKFYIMCLTLTLNIFGELSYSNRPAAAAPLLNLAAAGGSLLCLYVPLALTHVQIINSICKHVYAYAYLSVSELVKFKVKILQNYFENIF